MCGIFGIISNSKLKIRNNLLANHARQKVATQVNHI